MFWIDSCLTHYYAQLKTYIMNMTEINNFVLFYLIIL